ncbi:LOW QUALITY PROTEIN: uncharacterized protein LOC124492255 [Dermatophagoides farinae]|uniref:LOW QUALITY PROTEIN: uncharacterized protein LOC124492255 n=1 Tax=Dermatophagoides farinae TaxID=6954 RepID=UPI003F5DC121
MSMLSLIYKLKSLDKSKADSDILFQEIIDIRNEIEALMHWLAVSPHQQRQNIFMDDCPLIDQSSLQVYEFVLELIMSKYRRLILTLLQTSNRCYQNILKKHENRQKDRTKSNIITATTNLQQLIEIFNQKIAPYNEEILLKQTEQLEMLRVEYKKFGSLIKAKNRPLVELERDL